MRNGLPLDVCREGKGLLLGALAVLLGASAVSAAPVEVINSSGNLAGTYAGTSTFVTYGQTVDGLGAADVNFVARNNEHLMTAAVPRPLLGDNRYVTAEIYVEATEDTDGVTVVPQGINRMKVILRNPVGGAQATLWFGDDPGDATDAGMQWYPSQAGQWQTFSWDITQESWWDDSYETWEVYRVGLNESATIPSTNTDGLSNEFAIRNLGLVAVPEPFSFSAIGMGLGAMLLRRRR